MGGNLLAAQLGGWNQSVLLQHASLLQQAATQGMHGQLGGLLSEKPRPLTLRQEMQKDINEYLKDWKE